MLDLMIKFMKLNFLIGLETVKQPDPKNPKKIREGSEPNFGLHVFLKNL